MDPKPLPHCCRLTLADLHKWIEGQRQDEDAKRGLPYLYAGAWNDCLKAVASEIERRTMALPDPTSN